MYVKHVCISKARVNLEEGIAASTFLVKRGRAILRIRVNQGLLGRRHQKNGSDDGFIPLIPGEYNASQDLLGWIAIHRSNGENAYLNPVVSG